MTAPRLSRPGDEPGLRALWQTVFGDGDVFLNTYFREVYVPGSAALAEEDGRIVSAAHVLRFGAYRYIYAVATLPACRGRGYGRAVTLLAAGGKPAYLCPAGEGLKRWYISAMGARPAAARREYSSLPPSLRPISPAEFARRREERLQGIPHAEYTPGILSLFSLNGGFYEFDEDETWDSGICAVDNDGAVREMLPRLPGGEVYLLGLNDAPPLYWGLTLE